MSAIGANSIIGVTLVTGATRVSGATLALRADVDRVSRVLLGSRVPSCPGCSSGSGAALILVLFLT